MPKELTVIVPLIRDDLVERMLETLYEHTEHMFYVYIIDQSIRGVDANKLRDKYKNLMVIRSPKSDVHYTGNLGFASATNLGIQLVQTPYFMMLNDDCEMVHPLWWSGVMDTFKMVEKATPSSPAVIVNPASIRLADWSVGRPEGEDFDIIPYKKNFTDEDWRHLVEDEHYINEHLTIKPKSVFDGVTMYASVCDTQKFLEIGLLDERYHPGAGEDYDYSCRARMCGYRSVSTTLSWVWHHWSSSFKSLRDEEEIQQLKIPELAWNHNHEKWGPNFDIWGIKCPECKEIMLTKDDLVATCSKHPKQTYKMPEQFISPL